MIVNLVFSHLGFWSGNLFLIAPFPDLCLLVLFYDQSEFLNRGFALAREVINDNEMTFKQSYVTILSFFSGKYEPSFHPVIVKKIPDAHYFRPEHFLFDYRFSKLLLHIL